MSRNYIQWFLKQHAERAEASSLTISRRMILKGGTAAGAGLVLGVGCRRRGKTPPDGKSGDKPGDPPPAKPGDPPVGDTPVAANDFVANAFVRISPDDTVTVISKHIEFGQGTYTGLATAVAEELDADWSKVRVESAPADATRYNNLAMGPFQGTGGSNAMANAFMQMREAGAKARAMLVAAAAKAWGVEAGEITVADSKVAHAGSGKAATFGELAQQAATMEVPEKATLKDPKDFKLIGKTAARVDVPAKTDGSAKFTIDTVRPQMVTALVARSPRFGGKVKGFDASAAKAVAGVVDVVQVPTGVAVLAKNFWAARKGREALKVDWDDSEAETRSSEQLFEEYRALLGQEGKSVRSDGDAANALAGAAKVLEADFEFPYLAHAPMEPLDCVVNLGADKCDVWMGSQMPTGDQMAAAQVSGLDAQKVAIHTLLAGGSFGRRATPNSDLTAEAVSIAKAIEGRTPVRLLWTREDDIRGGRYRPMMVHRLRGGLDKAGNIVAWQQRVVGQSIMKGTFLEPMVMPDGIDSTMVEGASTLPYEIPNLALDLHMTEVGVPVLWWRSVGHTHTAYTTEVFFDMLVRAAGRDPLEERLRLLAKTPRLHAVVKLVGEKSGWGSPLPEGKARGIAMHKSFDTFVAQVAEISLDARGMPKVERVVCAVDCGIAINPDNVRNQMEGGVGYGLAAALHNEITLKDGKVMQSNFHDYQPMRIHEMPQVEVHIVPSGEGPTGMGEPGVPPIAPAVANAYMQLTGKTIHRLPFRRGIEGGAA